ncbi:caspase family protein [Nostoc sp. NIES-2111]
MTRKAVLISASNPPGNLPLAGPNFDLEIVRSYLMSEVGGGWHSNEIIPLYNAGYELVEAHITSLADFEVSYVYFSGHGGNDSGRDYILLSDGCTIWVDEIANIGRKRFVVIDACRNRSEPIIEGFAGLGDHPDFTPGNVSAGRDAFNKWIKTLGDGAIVIQACQRGGYSYDTPLGGKFTKAFYYYLSQLAKNQNPVSIADAMRIVRDELRVDNQIPVIGFSPSWKDKWLPIAISASPKRQVQVKENYAGIIVLGLVVGGLFYLGSQD